MFDRAENRLRQGRSDGGKGEVDGAPLDPPFGESPQRRDRDGLPSTLPAIAIPIQSISGGRPAMFAFMRKSESLAIRYPHPPLRWLFNISLLCVILYEVRARVITCVVGEQSLLGQLVGDQRIHFATMRLQARSRRRLMRTHPRIRKHGGPH